MGYKINQDVELYNESNKWDIEGKVIGQATVVSSNNDEMDMSYVVLLKEGFWNEDKNIFISMLLVHPDSMRAKEKDEPTQKEKDEHKDFMSSR